MPRDEDMRAGRLLEPTIQRYQKDVRRRLRKMARGSSRLGDLIMLFPAAAYALAIGRGDVAARGAAVRLVKDGARLRDVAQALDLPMWTRRLPPEAFRTGFEALPDGEEAARRLANLTPDDPETVADWFEWVAAAHAVAGGGGDGSELALWAAKRHRDAKGLEAPAALMAPIGVWIWFSLRPELQATRAAARGYTRSMGLVSAFRETSEWLDRAISVYAMRGAANPSKSAWFKTQSVGGFKFSPRRTPEELMQEGRVMNHCVGTYSDLVEKGVCLIYAIRRGGSPVATMEVRLRPDGSGKAYIVQLQGPSNAPVRNDVFRAAESWVKRQGQCPLMPPGPTPLAAIDQCRWEALWRPLHEDPTAPAIGRELFPLEPTEEAMRRLHRLQHAMAYYAR